MAPSVDKQTPTKMVLASEGKPMDICANVTESVAVFPRDYAHEFYQKATAPHHQRATFAYNHTHTDQRSHHDSYERLDHVACCYLVSQLADNVNRRDHEEEWSHYEDLMRGVLQGRVAINGIVDAIRRTTPLQLTVRRGDYEMMERLLRAGANADAHDAFGKTALHQAAERGDARAAEILLNRGGANPRALTQRGFNACLLAVQSGCATLVQLLLDDWACDVNELLRDSDMGRAFSLLHCAIECNNFSMVHLLLRYRADANQRDSFGNSCLHLASASGNSEIVQLLLDYNARVHQKNLGNLTALSIAVQNGHRQVFELLLGHGASLNDHSGASPLHHAVKTGDNDLIRVLLRHGAEVDATNRFGQTPLHFAVAEKNWLAMDLLLDCGADVNCQDSQGKTLLHAAIEAGRKDIYETLLRRGAKVDALDAMQQTPLHYAVRQGCLATVDLLLRHGANVNSQDNARQTPLHLAVRFGHAKLFAPMLRSNVDVLASDAMGQTPLHLAVMNEHSKLVYCDYSYTFFHELLKNGARVRARTLITGETPLHLAVRRKCSIFAKHLLCRGSDVDAIDNVDKKTPLRVAVENDDVECVEQLLTFGADVDRVNFGSRVSEAVARTLARHFVKKLAAGMSVEEKYSKIIGAEMEEFARLCEREVKIMKLMKIHNEQTYYDFLRGNRRCLVNLVGYSEVRDLFKNNARTSFSSDENLSFRRNFPIYADMLERNYYVGVRYAPILNAASETLGDLLALPTVPMDRILDFLDDDDMKNVVCVPSLTN